MAGDMLSTSLLVFENEQESCKNIYDFALLRQPEWATAKTPTERITASTKCA